MAKIFIKLTPQCFLVAFLFFGIQIGYAQSVLTVKESLHGNPIPNAEIFCNKVLLAKTNASGVATFKTDCEKVDVKARGYYEDEVIVDKVMELALSKANPKTKDIQEIVLSDKSDEKALQILKTVREKFNENSPQSLDSYTFKSYDKISYDIDEDSVKAYAKSYQQNLDGLDAPNAGQSKKEITDSLRGMDVLKLLNSSKLFLWERASEYLYSKQYGEKVNILDNRIAGLKEPVYELMALRSNRNKLPKEVLKENEKLYRYFLTDSIDIDNRLNYVIRFRQVDYRQPVQRRRFNGYIYVDAETYAIKKIESNSKIKSDGMITSIWQPIDNKWFLVKENLKVKAGATSLDQGEKKRKETDAKFGNYIFINTDYFDFKTNIPLDPKKFTGYTLSVKNSDGKMLDEFRTDSLSAREKMTYAKIDSVGRKYRLDEKVGLVSTLLKGKLKTGMVDWDVSRLIGYNQYEGLRLGAHAKLNEEFNQYISPDAYIAYGFKDSGLKYGAGLDVKTTLEKTSFFRAEYFNDVMAAGRFNDNLWNFKMKMMNSGVDVKNDRFFKFNGVRVGYQTDFGNALTVDISAKKQNEEAGFDYNFNHLGNSFENFSSMITVKYSPNSKNMMTPSGKITYEQNYPEFFVNFEQGFKTLGGDFKYSKADILINHRVKSSLGITGVRLYAGLVSGDVPIWHQFEMGGLGPRSITGFLSHFNLSSYMGFATMQAGKYYSDKFAGYYFTHRLPFYFKSFGKTTSSFDVIYRGTIGDMKNPEYHQFNFSKLDHLYQEVGLEYNNFLSSPFNLGLFYRVGYYATDDFKENFAIQLKLKFLGF